MKPKAWVAAVLVLAALAAAPAVTSPRAEPPPRTAALALADGPRVVLLGFDGASQHLAQQFIAEGRMPWCKKLMETGSFLPLGSSNPAESPVAWASVNTGMNPGKTNIFGFIRRNFRYPAVGKPYVTPTIGYSREQEIEVAGLKVPGVRNDLSCANFWDRLDEAGLESRVLQAACNFPAQAGPRTRLLAGLSVPDVRGGPGTFMLFTNSDWDVPRGTDTGGQVYKFKVVCPKCKNRSFSFTKGCSKCSEGKKPEELTPEQKLGWFETKLEGPDNFVARRAWDEKIKSLDERARAAKDGTPEKQQLQKELNTARYEKGDWEKEKGHASVPICGFVDKGDEKTARAGSVKFQLGGKEFTLKEGEWAGYVPVTFQIEGAFAVKAATHVHLAQCNPKADDVRFYLPAITAAADDPAPNMPVASPRAFGKELVDDVGYFDTIGWSCQTHALKDEEISEPSFLSAIWDTIQWRRRMLLSQLEKPDWRVLFQVFGETDRVSHMMYRFFDEKHPQYKAADADKTARFGDREIKYRDAIPAVYEEVDRTIGLVLERIEKGQLGDCTLMVCSDHGFSPFREEVEINAWLVEQGFLVLKKDPSGAPTGERGSVNVYADWSKTKAYSIGIGNVYLNLKGREPEGIVPKEDVVVDGKIVEPGYDRVCDEIISKMRAYRNPNADSPNDPRVFADAWKRSQYLAGPSAADLRDEQGRCTEGPADLQVGFNFGYRVGWGTAFGARSKDKVVFPNKSRWSGDHTSVHPYLVRGIWFCNRKTADGAMPHLQDLAPTILALQGVTVPDEMDGQVIPLVGLEQAAAQHKGGTANRESLVAPAK